MFENLRIQEEKGHVAFYDDNTKIYSFRNEELLKIRNEGDVQLSECIERLYGRRWVTPELKYQLARIISNKFPANSVNWQEQFYFIEYDHMLRCAFEETKQPEKKHSDLGKSQKDVKLEALAFIRFARDFSQTISHSRIKELVSEKIKRYQIRN